MPLRHQAASTGAEVYKRVIALCPEWHGETDDTGAVKMVMTGSATDHADLQPHIRSKSRPEAIRTRYKDPADPLKLEIVRGMWMSNNAPVLGSIRKPRETRGLKAYLATRRCHSVPDPGNAPSDLAGSSRRPCPLASCFQNCAVVRKASAAGFPSSHSPSCIY
jgi:hypothetical protein